MIRRLIDIVKRFIAWTLSLAIVLALTALLTPVICIMYVYCDIRDCTICLLKLLKLTPGM
jgi:hypothetical protein